MLRIMCLITLFAGCWLPPHLPDPIPSAEGTALHLDEARNLCVDTTDHTPDLRNDPLQAVQRE